MGMILQLLPTIQSVIERSKIPIPPSTDKQPQVTPTDSSPPDSSPPASSSPARNVEIPNVEGNYVS